MIASSMTAEKVYTVNEVAGMLRTTPKTVRRMIALGEIEAFKVRDEYRIRESVIEAIMRRKRPETKLDNSADEEV